MQTPKVLLVHGAFHGAWCWDRLIPALVARDIDATAIDLPFTSMADDVEAVAHAVDSMARGTADTSDTVPVIVVAHSGGGVAVTAGAAGGNGRAAATHLVYVAAVMPDPDDPFDLTVTTGISAVRPGDDGMMVMDPEIGMAAMYSRCSPETARWAIDQCRPMPLPDMSQREMAAVAWKTVPSTFVVCTADQAVHPDDQRRMAAKTGRSIELDSDHSPFLSDVEALADVLAEIVTSVSPAAMSSSA